MWCLAFAKCQLGKGINASLSVRGLKLFKAVTKIYIQIGAKIGLKIWTFFFFPLWKRSYICIVIEIMFNANTCDKDGNNCSTFVSFSRRKDKKQSGINE